MAFAQAIPAYAQQQTYSFNIPAQDLKTSLMEVAHVTRQQVIFNGRALRGKAAPSLQGAFTAPEALKRLLSGTGLEAVNRPPNLFVIRSAAPSPSSPGFVLPAGSDGNEKPSDIVVTGSHLHQTDFDSPIPRVVVGNEDLSEHGYTDLASALEDIPGIDQGVSLSNGQTAVQTNGLSTISLRGLGSNRTLVLIDGERAISNAGNSSSVSLSTIPTFFIDRVEVSTGGASAVYGSDAIAGVVNILTPQNFQGFKARVVGSATSDGGGGSKEYSFAAGKKFLDNRLYVMGTLTYKQQNILKATDRDWALDSVSYSESSNTISTPDLNSYTSGGRFPSASMYYDETGLHKTFSTAKNGYEDRTDGTLLTPATSWNAGGKLRFDVNDKLHFNAQFIYSNVITNSVREPYFLSYASTYGVDDQYKVGSISLTNPLVPSAIATASAKTGAVTFYRRTTEVGDITIHNNRTTLRGTVGFNGKVFGNWDWDLTYDFGKFVQNQVRENGVNLQNVKYALNVITASDGTLECADATARANGCVPLNIFGVGSISTDAANYIRANVWYRAVNRQDNVTGNLTGSPFSLPAGPVQLAAGFELRRNSTTTNTDTLTEQGLTGFAYTPQYKGTIKAAEGYVETSLPLLRDRSFAYRLSVDGAFRLAQYNLSGVGTTISYRLGAQWAPVHGINFRTTYSQAQRAPDVTELYSPARDDYETVVDPCSGVTAATTGTVAANCRSNVGIAAAIASNGVFKQTSTSVNTPNAGNSDLKEETARTFTAGVVFQPQFAKRLNFSIDYYDIRIKDAISTLDNATLLAECYSDTSGTSNAFCSNVTRDSTGQITKILNAEQNLDEMEASGIDVGFSYVFPVSKLPGRFAINARYSRRLKLETRFNGITGIDVQDENGQVGSAKDQALGSLMWSTKNLMLKWQTVFIGATVDSNEMADYFAANGITNPLYLHVPSYFRHDISFSIKSAFNQPNMRIFGTVQNVFNHYGAFLPDGTDSGNMYNYNSVYGVLGRTFSLGLQTQF